MEATDDLLARTENLDMSKVKARLIDPNKHGLSEQSAESAISAFKRFFFLAGVEGPPLVPTKVIDNVWHEFLMFTQDYEKACRTLFNKFVHHEPSTGTPDEAAILKKAFMRTQSLHQKHFNQEYATSQADCCDGSDGCQTDGGGNCCSTDGQ